jgi:hypothetical protein
MSDCIKDRCKINKQTNCWEWQLSVQKCGYGKAYLNKKMQSAHRVAYQLYAGPIPDNYWVLHSCDNRLCCNPQHLFLGDVKSNTQDKVDKQRQNRGTTVPQSKLTEAQVLEIRSKYPGKLQRELAAEYGISRSKISLIVNRKNWKHI